MSSLLATGSKQQRDARTCTSASVSTDYWIISWRY